MAAGEDGHGIKSEKDESEEEKSEDKADRNSKNDIEALHGMI